MAFTHSPLRYPGGKTQLSEFLKNLITINNIESPIYCEPFSGGFGAGLELLYSNTVDEVIINDLDLGIYSIWYSILNDSDKLIKLIEEVSIDMGEWYKQKKVYEELINSSEYSLELAFATFFLNRTNHSGIITGGPIGGHEQKSKYPLNSRFNKKTSIKKINQINSQKHRITLYNLEANDLISEKLMKLPTNRLFVFFDPPYYTQGNNLYTNFFKHDDHVTLNFFISKMDNYKWITTYDFNENISDIYKSYDDKVYTIRYSANRVRKEKEFLFYSPVTKIEKFDKVQFL